jgi:hypothetical protein
VFGNYGQGIRTNDRCSIIRNNIGNNSGGGLEIRTNCLVKENSFSQNQYRNIIVWSSGNSVEENLITGSENGILFRDSTGIGNFYINNRFSGNTNDLVNGTGNTDGGGNVSF